MLTKEMFAGLNIGDRVVVTYDNEERRRRANWRENAPCSFEATIRERVPYRLLCTHARIVVKPRCDYVYLASFCVGDAVTITKGWPKKSITSLGDRFLNWLERLIKGESSC